MTDLIDLERAVVNHSRGARPVVLEPWLADVTGDQVLERLASAVSAIPARSRLVLALVYRESLTLTQAAVALDVCRARASQLRDQALIELRAAICETAR